MNRRLLPGALILVAAASCTNPRVQENMAVAINDLTTELNAQRQDMAMLQEQIDSLRMVTAKQDTVIRRLVNVTGIPGLSP